MGRIVFSYFSMVDVAAFVLQTLRERSPVGSNDDTHPGLYRDSHMMFINGHSVADASGWRPGQEIEFSNPVPYARKIELGSAKLSAPPHVYEETAPIVAARFGNSVNVRFTFMPVQFGSIQAYAQSREGHVFKHRRPKALRDWLVRQPAIVITSR
jgi:hypothetical protein